MDNAKKGDGLLPTIHTSKLAITQILFSIWDNAIKYGREGIAPYLETEVRDKRDEWLLSIKDNGIGIAPESFDKIFLMFQRLHNRDEYEGTGIGLSIAKKNVEFMGGKIWLDSTFDEGSTFFFTLPKNNNKNRS